MEAEGWSTFLRNHAPDIAAMDFFVVPTIGFKLTPTHRLTTTNDVVRAVFLLLDNPAANGLDLTLDGGIQLV